MPPPIAHLVYIDPDASVPELLRRWAEGEEDAVFEVLCNDHPALALVFAVQGIRARCLNAAQVNTLVNRLIDHRRELCQ